MNFNISDLTCDCGEKLKVFVINQSGGKIIYKFYPCSCGKNHKLIINMIEEAIENETY